MRRALRVRLRRCPRQAHTLPGAARPAPAGSPGSKNTWRVSSCGRGGGRASARAIGRLDLGARRRGRAPAQAFSGHALGDQIRVQPHERIARALLLQRLGRLVGLRVLAGVAGKARHRQPQQVRRTRGAHARPTARCVSSRGLARIAAVALQDGEAGEARRGSRRCCRRGSAGAQARRCRRHCPRCRRASAACSVVAMLSADQKPLVAVEASPPSTTAMLRA